MSFFLPLVFSLTFFPSHSFTHSFPQIPITLFSLCQSLTHSLLTQSLTLYSLSITPSLTRSVLNYYLLSVTVTSLLIHSITHSILKSLSLSFSQSITHSYSSRSLFHSLLPFSHSYSLLPSHLNVSLLTLSVSQSFPSYSLMLNMCVNFPSGGEPEGRDQRLLHTQTAPGGPARLLDDHQQEHCVRSVRRLQKGVCAEEEPVHRGLEGPADRHAAAGQEAQALALQLLAHQCAHDAGHTHRQSDGEKSERRYSRCLLWEK